MAWEPPIFDRTQADVDYARSNRNDPNHYKGAFNYTDMNRIAENMHHIANVVGVALSVRTTWGLLEKPTQTEIEQLLSDLSLLRSAIPLGTALSVPERPIYQFEKINRIERMIFDLETRVSRILRSQRRLNTFQLGGDLI